MKKSFFRAAPSLAFSGSKSANLNISRLAQCFQDKRDPERIDHRLEEMLAQRIYGLALGYEDLNDHEQLRQDPLLAMLAGKRENNQPLVGKSTPTRMELALGLSTLYSK